MYEKTAPMFLVDDVDKAVAWYRHVLGARLQYSMPENPPSEWCSLLLGDNEIMFSQKKQAQNWYSNNVVISDTPANIIVYIYVKKLRSLYTQVKGKANIIMELTEQPYRICEFALQDPFGFVLIFAQTMK